MVPELCPLPSGLSVFYELFSAPRRCYVIQALRTFDSDTLAVRNLARAVAAAETANSSQVVTNGQYRNVYNALTQTHLSKLAAEEIIKYDSNRKVIAAGANFQTAHQLLGVTLSIYRVQERDLRETSWRLDCNG